MDLFQSCTVTTVRAKINLEGKTIITMISVREFSAGSITIYHGRDDVPVCVTPIEFHLKFCRRVAFDFSARFPDGITSVRTRRPFSDRGKSNSRSVKVLVKVKKKKFNLFFAPLKEEWSQRAKTDKFSA